MAFFKHHQYVGCLKFQKWHAYMPNVTYRKCWKSMMIQNTYVYLFAQCYNIQSWLVALKANVHLSNKTEVDTYFRISFTIPNDSYRWLLTVKVGDKKSDENCPIESQHKPMRKPLEKGRNTIEWNWMNFQLLYCVIRASVAFSISR